MREIFVYAGVMTASATKCNRTGKYGLLFKQYSAIAGYKHRSVIKIPVLDDLNFEMNLVSKSDWWYPKARNQRGEIWINDSAISQDDLNRIDLIANLCLAEICIGNIKNFNHLF